MNCCVPAASIVGAVDATETEIPPIDMGAEADADEFATDVAVTVTAKPPGGIDPGTVYIVLTPYAVFVGVTEPHEVDEHETDQLTPPFSGPVTEKAVNAN